MRTTSTSQGKIPKPIPTSTEPQDAITLLTEDHEHVKSMFEQYEELGDRAHVSKHKLALQICEELTQARNGGRRNLLPGRAQGHQGRRPGG